MLRRLIVILCALSLLIFQLGAFLWIRSYWSTANLNYTSPRLTWYVMAVDGQLEFVRNDYRRPLPLRGGDLTWSLSDPPLSSQTLSDTVHPWRDDERAYKAFGFLFVRQPPPPYVDGPTITIMLMPVWPILAITAVPPALWLFTWWRKRRRTRRWIAAGRCPHCGYSLAGITSPVCPECGAPAV